MLRKRVTWRARGPVPQDSDVIVIGAGLGGLMCAAILAARGRKVTVLEAHSQPGGYAHAFNRRGFRFDVSLHHIGGLMEPGEPTYDFLDAVGVRDKLDVVMRDTLLTIDVAGRRVVLPNGGAGALEALVRQFPGEAEGLRRLFSDMSRIRDALISEEPDGDALELKGRFRGATWADVVAPYVTDPILLAVLDQLWMYVGLPPSQAAGNYWIKVFGSWFLDGSAYIRGGTLAPAFCERLAELGSAVYTNRPVAKILVEDGAARGVELEDGTVLRADLVVSNADPYQTFLGMLPPGTVSEAFKFRLGKQAPSISLYAMYLALDCEPEDVGIAEGAYFCCHDADLDGAYARALAHDIDRTDWTLTAYADVEEQDSKAHRVIAICEPTPARDWLEMDDETYAVRKKEVGDRLMAKYFARLPGLEGHVVTREFGTPRTMTRYTRNRAGAVYGFAQLPGQANTLRMGNRSPVPGLYLASAWVRPGGGWEGTMLAGIETARQILGERSPLPQRAPKAAPAEPPPQTLRITYQDTDATGHAYHGALCRFLDRGRAQARPGLWPGADRLEVVRSDVRFMNAGNLGRVVTPSYEVVGESSQGLLVRERLRDGERVLVEGLVCVRGVDGQGTGLPVPKATLSGPGRRRPPGPASMDQARTPVFHHYETPLDPGDTDAVGNLRPEAHVRLVERARWEAMAFALGTFFQEAVRSHTIRIYRIEQTFHAPVPPGARVRVETAAQVPSQHRVCATHRTLDAVRETLLVESRVEMLQVDSQGKLSTWPDDLAQRFIDAVARAGLEPAAVARVRESGT